MTRVEKSVAVVALFWTGALGLMLLQPSGVRVVQTAYASTDDESSLDKTLAVVLSNAGFTGNIQQIFQQRLEANLGRPIDQSSRTLVACYGLTRFIPSTTTIPAADATRRRTGLAIRNPWLSACKTPTWWGRTAADHETSAARRWS